MVVERHLTSRLEVHDAARNEDAVELLYDDVKLGVGVVGRLAFVDWTEGSLKLSCEMELAIVVRRRERYTQTIMSLRFAVALIFSRGKPSILFGCSLNHARSLVVCGHNIHFLVFAMNTE